MKQRFFGGSDAERRKIIEELREDLARHKDKDSDLSPIHFLILKHIDNLDRNPKERSDLEKLLSYNFMDVKDKIDELIDLLIEESKKGTIEGRTKGVVEDEDYLMIMLAWYAKIPEEQKRFPMSHEDYLNSKARELAEQIYRGLIGKKPPFKVLDIGFGDAQMTLRVPQQLAKIYSENGFKINIEPHGIDLGDESTAAKWEGAGGTVGSGAEAGAARSAKSTLIGPLQLYFYDGTNLAGAMRRQGMDLGSFDVVMCNHALHHWPNFDAQLDALRNMNMLLKDNGVLFLTEHANVMNNQYLHLQHMLFDLISEVRKLMQAYRHTAAAAAAAATVSDEFDARILRQIQTYGERKEDIENYFSRDILLKIAKHYGFELVQSATRDGVSSGSDTTYTVFYTWKKTVDVRLGRDPWLAFSASGDDANKNGHADKLSNSAPPRGTKG